MRSLQRATPQGRLTTRPTPQVVPLRAPSCSPRAACFAPEAAATDVYTLEVPAVLLDLVTPAPPPPASLPPAFVEGAIVELTPDTFLDFLKSRELTVVDFYTDWCGPCKVMSKEFEKFPKTFKSIAFAKLNCGKGHEEFATRHRIRSLPTFRIYRRGLLVDEVTGGRPVQLRQMVLHHSWR